MKISIKRVYDPPDKDDGFRILVDRLWPRGISKDKAAIDLWLKEVAPSDELRQWFGHDPARWEELRERYRAELQNNAAFDQLRKIAGQHRKTTLLFAAKDTEHNNAVALADFLIRKSTPQQRREAA